MPAPANADAIVALARIAAKRFGIPASLIYAQIMQESGGQPDAIGDQGRARGLMQLHRRAAEEAGFSHDEMLDPEKNVAAGSSYMSQQMERFAHDPARALSAYNAGPGRTLRSPRGVAPSAAPYVDKVQSGVARVTRPGGEFEDETQPLPDSAAQDLSLDEIMDQDRVTRIVNMMRGRK